MKVVTTNIIIFAMFLVVNLSAQTFVEKSDLLKDRFSINFIALSASTIDYNNDGLVDIYFPQSDTTGILYKNFGENGFTNVISNSSLNDIPISEFGSWGGIWGDYDNDGLLDVYFINAYKLFRNKGNGGFEDVTSLTNISILDSSFFQGIAWADFNLDGNLDLFLGEDNGNNQLLINNNNQSFVNDDNANVKTIEGTYGVAVADLNNDRYPEIFIGACRHIPALSRNHLLLNNSDGTFTNIGESAGINDSLAAWGVVFLDYDNDMDYDVYVANMYVRGSDDSQPGFNKLYRNDGNLKFSDVSIEAGVEGEKEDRTFGIATADFNNDGWYDLIESNTSGSGIRILKNNKDGTFTNISNLIGVNLGNNNGMAIADFNNDGWIDIITNGYRLFMNEGGSNNWISVKTIGTQSNSFGVGTRVEVYSGGLHQIREINAGDGFISQNNNLSAHFGLAENAIIDSLIVKWPASGIIDKFKNVEVNQYLIITEGQGYVTSVDEQNVLPTEFKLFQNYPNPFNPETKIKFSIPKISQVRLLIYDIQGKEMELLLNETKNAGDYEINFNGSQLASGVYFYSLEIDKSQILVQKMVLLK